MKRERKESNLWLPPPVLRELIRVAQERGSTLTDLADEQKSRHYQNFERSSAARRIPGFRFSSSATHRGPTSPPALAYSNVRSHLFILCLLTKRCASLQSSARSPRPSAFYDGRQRRKFYVNTLPFRIGGLRWRHCFSDGFISILTLAVSLGCLGA
jgi:hypothetical protein